MTELELLEILGEAPEVDAVYTVGADATPFLEKPLDEYTTTEGLLLILCILVFLSFLGGLLGRCFNWL